MMRRLVTRKERQSSQSERPPITYYLAELLPPGHTFVYHQAFNTFSYLQIAGQQVKMLAQEQFSPSEVSLVLPLFEHYPRYCPHEAIFANFYYGELTETAIARARQRLREAQEYGATDQEMRPVRNVLSRARLKLKGFGLDVCSLLEVGYMLVVRSTR